jgi:ABC-type transport system substrate-binding protein
VIGHRARPAIPETDTAGPRFTARIVVARVERDLAEARALRATLDAAGIRLRIRAVDPALVHPLYADPHARVAMGIATWCADWPGLAGRNVLGSIADPRAARDAAPNPIYARLRSPALVAALEAAERAPADEAGRAWARATLVVERTAALIPLVYPMSFVVAGHTVGGFTPAPMWPRGDPAALWLGVQAGQLETADGAAG